jgi:hypothetical protein
MYLNEPWADARALDREALFLDRIEAALTDFGREVANRIIGWSAFFWVTTLLAIVGSRLL